MRSDVLVIVTCDSNIGCLEQVEIPINPDLNVDWQVAKRLHHLGWTSDPGQEFCPECSREATKEVVFVDTDRTYTGSDVLRNLDAVDHAQPFWTTTEDDRILNGPFWTTTVQPHQYEFVPTDARIVGEPGLMENIHRAFTSRYAIRWPTRATLVSRWRRFFDWLVASPRTR